jgi:hypothetical protein
MIDTTKPMAHREAEETMAVDRYLLNELTEAERMRFEEHYFECAECAEALEAGQIFINGIRPIPAPLPWWRKMLEFLRAPLVVPAWGMWAVAGTAAASLALVGIQGFWPAAPLANTVLLAGETVKGAAGDKTYTLKTPSATVEVALLDVDFPYYRVDITRGSDGKTHSQVVPAPPKDAEHRLSVQISRKALGVGHFTVTVAGLATREARQSHPVDTYYFQIDKTD